MRLASTLFLTSISGAGCIAERTIDEIIADHGVTWLPETSGTETTGTSTGTSSSGGSTVVVNSTSSGEEFGTSTESSVSTGSSGDDETTDETSVSTDLPSQPQCGNGIVEDDETCDDANDVPDDGCNACAKDSIVFVTSELYQGGAIGGLDMADQRCRGLAAMAGLPRFETYRAWLSSQTVAAKDRLLHSKGRYVLVNGLPIANDWDELTSGLLQRPIDVDEQSATNLTGVWTGTWPDGSLAGGTTLCDDWTDFTLGQQGVSGDSNSFDMYWTYVAEVGCGGEAALYCIEQ